MRRVPVRRLLLGMTLVLLAGAALWWYRTGGRDDTPIRWDDLAPPAESRQRPWMAIVIHHSGARRGTVSSIDRWHRQKGWDGIGYHFVIGNGRDMALGRVEPTFRWQQQREGAHAGSATASRPYNQQGVGICLIGDFDQDQPDSYQIERLADLCAELIRHCPALSAARIIGHREVPGKDTECPGRNLDIEHLRWLVRQRLGG